ncbi:MAG: DUF3617 family protein [Gammaproteobacteria bacterium]|nr:DUF3617 family protein [Gammaproteobacteria bacterium]
MTEYRWTITTWQMRTIQKGNTATWTMECKGKMPMTGTGLITFAADGSYTGAITATAEGMSMKINLTGRKIGTCDNPIG